MLYELAEKQQKTGMVGCKCDIEMDKAALSDATKQTVLLVTNL